MWGYTQKLQEILGLHIKIHSKPAINTCVQNNNTVNKKNNPAPLMILVIPSTDRTKAIRIKRRFYQQQKKERKSHNRHEMNI